ncbi:MAG TPA: DUF4142 domain-containing protein [Candidatus Binatia bacterium]|nr:DUF4142 domain-containing protein [Candidatus Binatia bacterium]
MKFLGRSLVVATAGLLLIPLAFAQRTADQQFMSEAAQDGMLKIQLAYLALQNAQNPQVKSFAQQTLSDYANSQNDLIFVANQEFVLLPGELDARNRDTVEALSQLHGAAFDKAYIKAMLTDHQTRFKQEAAKVGSRAITDWANKTLPTFQSELKEAQKVAPVVGIQSTPAGKQQPVRSGGQPSGGQPSSGQPGSKKLPQDQY